MLFFLRDVWWLVQCLRPRLNHAVDPCVADIQRHLFFYEENRRSQSKSKTPTTQRDPYLGSPSKSSTRSGVSPSVRHQEAFLGGSTRDAKETGNGQHTRPSSFPHGGHRELHVRRCVSRFGVYQHLQGLHGLLAPPATPSPWRARPACTVRRKQVRDMSPPCPGVPATGPLHRDQLHVGGLRQRN